MEKTSVLDDHMVCLLAGLSADANTLIENIRVSAQRYLFKYQEPQPCEMLVKSICNYKQSYTQFGGLRPFGVAFILAGWDKHFGFQLYQSDPSGNYSGWKATVVGQNNQAGKSMLKTEYKDGATVASNTKLAIKILLRTMDSATPTPERIELSTLTCDENGKVKFSVIPQESIQSIIDEVKKEEEEEAKEKAASASDI
jgi:20S proteasome subunit alpha 3